MAARRRAMKPIYAPLFKPTLHYRPKHKDPIPTHPHLIPHHHRRALATSPRTAAPSRADIFSLSQIPQSAFESVISRNANSFTRLSCEEYYAVAKQFAEAIRRGSDPWAVSFSSKDGISADIMHAVACIMRQISSRSADAFAMALWSSASQMGYRPATLSLARQLIRSGSYGRVPQLRGVEARYKQLVGSGRDADALTAEGELLFEQGRYDGAVVLLRRALQIGGAFEWRPYCDLCLGKAYDKMGMADEAKEIFVRLADEGMVEADVELVDLMRRCGLEGAEGAEQRMYTAACNGRRDMFTRLSEAELEKVNGKRIDENRGLWALEWSKLADRRVEY